MDYCNLQKLIADGESLTVEFKKAATELPKSLFETICAFLNRQGGTVLLGVADDKTVIGVDPDKADDLCKDISNLSNNDQKLSPSFINANRPHSYGTLTPGSFEPFPKNPNLAKIFAQMGRADDLGTGISKVFKYIRAYTGEARVEFLDDDLFTVRVPLGDAGTEFIHQPVHVPANVPANVPAKRRLTLINLVQENPNITTPQMAKRLGVDVKTVKRDLGKLRQEGTICRVGSDKSGHWAILANVNHVAAKAEDVQR
jgi:predicted HTH transcriptional regulator